MIGHEFTFDELSHHTTRFTIKLEMFRSHLKEYFKEECGKVCFATSLKLLKAKPWALQLKEFLKSVSVFSEAVLTIILFSHLTDYCWTAGILK